MVAIPSPAMRSQAFTFGRVGKQPGLRFHWLTIMKPKPALYMPICVESACSRYLGATIWSEAGVIRNARFTRMPVVKTGKIVRIPCWRAHFSQLPISELASLIPEAAAMRPHDCNFAASSRHRSSLTAAVPLRVSASFATFQSDGKIWVHLLDIVGIDAAHAEFHRLKTIASTRCLMPTACEERLAQQNEEDAAVAGMYFAEEIARMTIPIGRSGCAIIWRSLWLIPVFR